MENEKEIQEVLAFTMKDNALVHLVICANAGVGTPVTLLVDGQVVNGDLVSGEVYSKDMAQKIRGTTVDEGLKDTMASFFDSLSKDYSVTDDSLMPLNFLHLKNPSYMRGDGDWVTHNDTILRVSIEKVSGFNLGKFSNS